ncbi:uncharacterized protein LOC128996024 [Macrosteles quadrilineatus]|uniref:uncharacterized protein LOC128996024 n=1 Tax=Macrosteles quadrilineatus TaxID=74068 RepID=UPI0023E171EA|nr:uncharacterized protein LOC128996024 [Macrosteles quadrilineatus]
MPPTWFTPEQYMKARQHYWQKLEKNRLFILPEKPPADVITYFNGPNLSPKSQAETCAYDAFYHFEPGWDQHISRADRSNPKLIHKNIHNEEQNRIVPVVTSSNYGHRKTELEGKSLVVHKKTHPTREFYRVNNTNLKPSRGLLRDSSTIL